MLDERLETAFDLYDPCTLAADIGTDHAHLPSALLRRGKCERMILTELSESALENARREITSRNLESVTDLRLGDGLKPLTEKCDMISILGMGGRTIAQILETGRDHLCGATLLLSAHTDTDKVRKAVSDIGYHLSSETPVLANNRFYLIFKALPGEETLTELEIRLGKKLFESTSPRLLPYLRRRMCILETRMCGLTRSADTDPICLQTLRNDIKYLGAQIARLEKRPEKSDS